MTGSGLSGVARWDAAPLRNAVTTLGDVGERLVAWRARVEHVGRALGDTGSWSGPAATATADALVHVSTVVTQVSAALATSLDDADRMVAAVATAAGLAGEALAAAAAVPVSLDEQGRLGPLPDVPLDPSVDPAVALQQQFEAITAQSRAAAVAAELAGDALRSAGQAALAAQDAVAALGGVGVVGGSVPADLGDLMAVVGLAGVPATVAPPAGPTRAAGWWAALSEEQRNAWITGHPELIGATAGLPAWARDRANRLLLGRLLVDAGAPGADVAQATFREIAAREAAGEAVQLYEFAPEQGLVALALGDLDTADHVGVLVPGTATTVTDDLDAVVDDAAAVAGAALAAAPGAAVATVAWLGYRTPPDLGYAWIPAYAQAGGGPLAGTLDGLAAARSTSGGRAHTVVLAHSYGSQVVAAAAEEPGRLAADDVVLAGSPGMEGDAGDLEVGDVYQATGGDDPIRFVPLMPDLPGHPVFADAVWDEDYGATALPVEEDMSHSDYYDPDRPTLVAMGEVLVGGFDP
ncbi:MULTISPECIES: alpha/beta hydrolase [unclassified Blastococcus]